jgi:hypothetical protein
MRCWCVCAGTQRRDAAARASMPAAYTGGGVAARTKEEEEREQTAAAMAAALARRAQLQPATATGADTGAAGPVPVPGLRCAALRCLRGVRSEHTCLP